MKRLLALGALLGLILLGAPARATAHPVHTDGPTSTCTCVAARAENGWCGACGAGYVAGVRMTSTALYEVIDAHGHDVDSEHIPCPSCRTAFDGNGWCPVHATGFAGGRGYVSRLAWLLARGEADQAGPEVERLRAAVALESACDLCAAAAFTDARCPRCNIVYAGGRPVAAPRRP